MITYAYSDETEFMLSDSNVGSLIGAGVLITKEEISEVVIAEALAELSNDNSKTPKDLKTLNRGYFHASEDSKNAHSYLCKSINKYVSGCFRYSYYDKQKKIEFERIRSNENIKRLTLQLASLEFFYKKIDKVVLTIENRYGFSEIEATNWKESFYNLLDGLAYEQPSYLTFYPDMQIKSGNKYTPGLQVTDFILWALNRSKRHTQDLTWKKRLNFRFSSDHSSEDAPPSGGHYYLNELPNIAKELSYPFHNYDSTSLEEFQQSYMTIEQNVRRLCKLRLPNSLSYLNPQLLEINNLFEFDKTFTEKNLLQVASLYIRLFDSLPIYNNLSNTDAVSWSKLLRAKKTAGLILRQDLIEGYRSAMAILDLREEIIKTNNKHYLISA